MKLLSGITLLLIFVFLFLWNFYEIREQRYFCNSHPFPKTVSFNWLPKRGKWGTLRVQGLTLKRVRATGFSDDKREAQGVGTLRCRLPFQNPARTSRERWIQETPEFILNPVSWQWLPPKGFGKVRVFFLGFLQKELAFYPHLRKLALAAWTGEVFKEDRWAQVFSQAGLDPLLALSGQHIVVLSVILSQFFNLLFILFPKVRSTRGRLRFSRWLPWMIAVLLSVVSGGMPSLERTLSCLLLLSLVRERALRVEAYSLFFSAMGILLLLEGPLLASPGFILSAWGTFALLGVSTLEKNVIWNAIWLSLWMPLLLCLWIVYCFGSANPFVALHQLLAGLLWEWVILPLSFFLPFLHAAFSGAVFSEWWSGLNNGSRVLLEWGVGHFSIQRYSVLPLGAIETVLLSVLMLSLALRIRSLTVASQELSI